MDKLREQPDFWQALLACIPERTQRQLDLEDSSDARQSWLDRQEAAWRFLAESAALQILALEAFRHPKTGKSGKPPA